MKLLPLLIALLALALPLTLWARAAQQDGLMTDRAGEAGPAVATAAAPSGYAAR